MSSDRLMRHLPPQRVGDPLGLGISSEDRPPPPSDPDAHNLERENNEYARSLLSEADRKSLDKDIDKKGWLSVDDVRSLILEHSVKGSIDSELGLDPEVLILIDQRTNMKLFLAGDNIYTREELYRHYPFQEFGVQPEAIFAAQEVGIFPPKKYALKEDLEYLARDAGDETAEFIMLEDMVGAAARRDYVDRRAPLRIVKTKIYVGREHWRDFETMTRLARCMVRVSAAQIAYGGAGASGSPFAALLGRSTSAGPLSITDAATAAADAAAREAALERREAELRDLMEAARLREEAARRREEEVNEKIAADISRLERMLARAAAPTAEPAAAPTAEPTDDSVPL